MSRAPPRVFQEPEFDGRQVVTFHNQRDYIFVRFHRYVFAEGKGDGKEKKTRARLQVGDAAARLHTLEIVPDLVSPVAGLASTASWLLWRPPTTNLPPLAEGWTPPA